MSNLLKHFCNFSFAEVVCEPDQHALPDFTTVTVWNTTVGSSDTLILCNRSDYWFADRNRQKNITCELSADNVTAAYRDWSNYSCIRRYTTRKTLLVFTEGICILVQYG